MTDDEPTRPTRVPESAEQLAKRLAAGDVAQRDRAELLLDVRYRRFVALAAFGIASAAAIIAYALEEDGLGLFFTGQVTTLAVLLADSLRARRR